MQQTAIQRSVTVNNTSIPSLGLGTWQLTPPQARDIIPAAVEQGYRHIDTAQAYENEDGVGEGLQQAQVDREDVFLTTKVWLDNYAPERFAESVERSLKRLKTEYVDLLLLHWPSDEHPLEPTLELLWKQREAGRARAIGVSNFPSQLMERAHEFLDGTLVCNQVEYHPLLSQETLTEQAARLGYAITAYSPLARGQILENEVLRRLAQVKGCTVAQLSLAWLLSQQDVLAIPKTSKKSRLVENIASMEIELTEEEFASISALATPQGRIIDPDFAPKWDQN